MTQFQHLLSQHVGTAMLKQSRLDAILGKHNWNVDLQKGTADFDRGRVFPLQVIGTESESSATWLWGWANTGSEIPAKLLASSNQLRELGIKDSIEELSSPQIPLGQADGYALTIVAVGVSGADAYYRGSYDGGALYFTVTGLPPSKKPASPVELINIMSQVVTNFTVDHRTMVSSFLEQQGYSLEDVDGNLVAKAAHGTDIHVNFDGQGQISGMETKAGTVAEDSEKKPWWKRGKG